MRNIKLVPIEEPIKAKYKRSRSKLERNALPSIDNRQRGSSIRNLRNQFDVAKSIDVNLNKYKIVNQSLNLSGVHDTNEVLYKWGSDGYNPPVANPKFKLYDSVEAPWRKKNFVELEALNQKRIPAQHNLDRYDSPPRFPSGPLIKSPVSKTRKVLKKSKLVLKEEIVKSERKASPFEQYNLDLITEMDTVKEPFKEPVIRRRQFSPKEKRVNFHDSV